MTQQMPGVYRGTVAGPYDQDPARMCWVVVPSVSGVQMQLAQLSLLPDAVSHGTLVWVAYERGDIGRPVVISLAPKAVASDAPDGTMTHEKEVSP